MTRDEQLFQYLLRLGDSPLILAQRLGEWVGHGPVLEEDIAQTNVGLDLLGQARLWLTYAGEVEARYAPAGRDEDDARVPARQRSVPQPPASSSSRTAASPTRRRGSSCSTRGTCCCCARSRGSGDATIAGIAAKAAKEAAYHVERSGDWVIRLGDGTDESHAKMQAAIDDLWTYTGEMFTPDAIEQALVEAGIAADVRSLAAPWRQHVDAVFAAATLEAPGSRLHAAGRQAGRAHRAPRPPARGDAGPAALVSRSTLVIDALPPSLAPGDLPPIRRARRRGRRSTRSGRLSTPCRIPKSRPCPSSSSASCAASNGTPPTLRLLVVTVTPTYSGCPATELIMTSIRDAVDGGGCRARLRIETRLAPAWTTDWLTSEARRKLRDFGIAPPEACARRPRRSPSTLTGISPLRRDRHRPWPVRAAARRGRNWCPSSDRPHARRTYRCLACLEPFDYFKPH